MARKFTAYDAGHRLEAASETVKVTTPESASRASVACSFAGLSARACCEISFQLTTPCTHHHGASPAGLVAWRRAKERIMSISGWPVCRLRQPSTHHEHQRSTMAGRLRHTASSTCRSPHAGNASGAARFTEVFNRQKPHRRASRAFVAGKSSKAAACSPLMLMMRAGAAMRVS